MELLEKIQQALKKTADKDPEEVNLQTNFIHDLNMDSLDLVEMVMCIEEEFDLEIPDEVAEKFTTVQNVIDYLEAQGVAA